MPTLEAFEAGAFAWWFTETGLMVATRPAAVRTDDRRRLHCEDGPAFVWLDDVRDHYWHGVYVPDFVVEAPSKITVALIDAEQNAEVRRVMIDRYRHGEEIKGAAAFLRDAGAIRLDHDERWGTLWRREVTGDEPIVVLEVVNRSREPDGSFKHYWLRVHPQLLPLPPGDWNDEMKAEFLRKQKPQAVTAHNAVASLHGLRGEEYSPAVET
ncbi:MAG: hypothetical protein A3E01_02980 [Gammaproteobacteria bacterium RIFCSPHIGHO2_12_FULL_63_22]|nr:MAG: hypothetical protein A3E01_02980 [Gammaproteobacteria bacterium RIFCSPHIGHO2_12_FULL_63_22]